MKQLLPILCCCLVFTLLWGCAAPAAPSPAPSAAPASAQIFAMDTVMDLTLYGDEALLREVTDRIYALEHLLSVTEEQSELARLNRGETVTLSEDTRTLLREALSLCAATDGALDVSIYPVLRAWGFTTGDYAVPSPGTLAALLQSVDYRRVLPAEDGTLTLPEGMEIDLGSVAKGYTAEILADFLRQQGVASALLNLGGNVQTVGRKPDGSFWRIAIRDPFTGGYLGIIQAEDQAVVTSGGYERYFEQDGKTYWHILDPKTGAPAESGLVSVTVVSDSGLLCDGLSTALFVLGPDRAAAFWRERADHGLGDFEAVFVEADGSVSVTAGLADRFSLTDGGDFRVIEEAGN